jgi:heat-inducible transcriptional repressor
VLTDIFKKFTNEKPIVTLIGDEIGLDSMNECSIVYSAFKFFRGETGYLAVIGPRRMKYSRVIPSVRAVSEMIEESIKGWE